MKRWSAPCDPHLHTHTLHMYMCMHVCTCGSNPRPLSRIPALWERGTAAVALQHCAALPEGRGRQTGGWLACVLCLPACPSVRMSALPPSPAPKSTTIQIVLSLCGGLCCAARRGPASAGRAQNVPRVIIISLTGCGGMAWHGMALGDDGGDVCLFTLPLQDASRTSPPRPNERISPSRPLVRLRRLSLSLARRPIDAAGGLTGVAERSSL